MVPDGLWKFKLLEGGVCLQGYKKFCLQFCLQGHKNNLDGRTVNVHVSCAGGREFELHAGQI